MPPRSFPILRGLAALAILVAAANVARGAPPPELRAAPADPPVVEVRGDAGYYTGGFKNATSHVFDAAVAGRKLGQVTRVVIRSGGGDTVAGYLGDGAHEQNSALFRKYLGPITAAECQSRMT